MDFNIEELLLSFIKLVINNINGIFENMTTLLETPPDQFANGGPWGVVTQVNTALQGLGYGLLILFFLMSFLKNTTNIKELSLQQIAMLILRFILVKALIDYSLQIFNLIISVSLGANEAIFNAGGGLTAVEVPQSVIDAVNNSVTSGSWWERIPQFFSFLGLGSLTGIAALVILICGIILVITVYMRFFKVFIYTAIAPIPLATLGGKETSDTGKHFLKAYAAVCLEICVIALAVVIFTSIINGGGMQIWASWTDYGDGTAASAFWGVTLDFILQLVIQVILLTVSVTSANKIIREIIGV